MFLADGNICHETGRWGEEGQFALRERINEGLLLMNKMDFLMGSENGRGFMSPTFIIVKNKKNVA